MINDIQILLNSGRLKNNLESAKYKNDTEIQIALKILFNYTDFYITNDIKIRYQIIKQELSNNDLICKNHNCNNQVEFNKQNYKFKDYCCVKCMSKSKQVKQKIKETCILKYGVESVNSTQEKKDQVIKTNLEKYGTKCVFSNSEIITKIKKTNLKLFGNEVASMSTIISNKIKNTNNLRYSSDYPYQSKLVQEIRNQNNMLKFNSNSPFGSKDVQLKIIETKIDNSIFWNDADYIEKNFLDSQKHILSKKFRAYFNCSSSIVYKKFEELNIEFTKRTGNSEAETEIIEFIDSDETIQGDRTLINKELDILVPNNFAIEYNGLMFHSQGISKYSMFNNPTENKKRHLDKTELVENKEIQLFQIFENEWDTKQDIWKSVINSKMGRTTRIFGRKTVIKDVDAKTAREFEDLNHLQGHGNAKFRYGLYYKDELVSLMTFGKARMSKQYEYELIRFCSKLNHTVLGAASKLLKHFEKTINPVSLVTYANRRWSTGHLYKTIGFIFSHISQPNYFYFKPENQNLLESRNKYQKHKLHKILPIFNAELTETVNMYNNDFRKIYDSGNIVFYKIY